MARIFTPQITANFAFSFDIVIADTALLVDNTFKVSLRGPATVDLVGVLVGTTVTFSGTVAVSGLYRYTLFASNSTNVRTLIETGDITVGQDSTLITDDTDLRNQAQRMLDAIDALLANKATKDQQAYSIAGRSITKIPFKELTDLREYYRKEVQRYGYKLPRAVLTVFRSR